VKIVERCSYFSFESLSTAFHIFV